MFQSTGAVIVKVAMTATPGRFSYNEVTIYEKDVALLKPGEWLNDQILSFALHFLNHSLGTEIAEEVVVVDALVGSCLRFNCDSDERRDFAGGVGVKRGCHILAPVTDCRTLTSVPGHWSLLYFDVARGVAVHFDSMATKNATSGAAADTAQALWEMCGSGSGGNIDDTVPGGGGGIGPTLVEAQEHHIPQQRNGHDCGVYAALFARHVHEHLTQPCAHRSPLDELDSPFYAHLRTVVDQEACDVFRADTTKLLTRAIQSGGIS